MTTEQPYFTVRVTCCGECPQEDFYAPIGVSWCSLANGDSRFCTHEQNRNGITPTCPMWAQRVQQEKRKMSDKPKSCPWCGWSGDRIDVKPGTTFRWMAPECPNCGATPGEERIVERVPAGKPIDTPKNYAAALVMWNTRAEPPKD